MNDASAVPRDADQAAVNGEPLRSPTEPRAQRGAPSARAHFQRRHTDVHDAFGITIPWALSAICSAVSTIAKSLLESSPSARPPIRNRVAINSPTNR